MSSTEYTLYKLYNTVDERKCTVLNSTAKTFAWTTGLGLPMNPHSPVPEPERLFWAEKTRYIYLNNPQYQTPSSRPP
jgi:hypothetical protein